MVMSVMITTSVPAARPIRIAKARSEQYNKERADNKQRFFHGYFPSMAVFLYIMTAAVEKRLMLCGGNGMKSYLLLLCVMLLLYQPAELS